MSQLGRSSYPGSLQRLRLDNLHFDALFLSLSLSLSPFQLSSDNPPTGWIDTTYGRISFVDPILNLESIDSPLFSEFVKFSVINSQRQFSKRLQNLGGFKKFKEEENSFNLSSKYEIRPSSRSLKNVGNLKEITPRSLPPPHLKG